MDDKNAQKMTVHLSTSFV